MVIKLLAAVLLGASILGGTWVWRRWEANPEGVIPLPYKLPALRERLVVDAPLLIVGDRMGARLALFKEEFSEALSKGLSKPLKIHSLARPFEGLHRTLRQLEAMPKWPRVVLYQGGSEEMHESKFFTREIPRIQRNFSDYADDRRQTAMMVWPPLSRLLYRPLVRVVLPAEPPEKSVVPKSDAEYQARLAIAFRLYEMELLRLVELARSRKSLLILTTVPVNIDVPPRRTCANAGSPAIAGEVAAVRELIRAQDYKAAYTRSQKLNAATLANAEVLYLHGQVARRSGQNAEALDNLRRAAAFDCVAWRATDVSNGVIRKVAREEGVMLFDFDRMVTADWGRNTTFYDTIYPQNLYYQRAVGHLATVLRRVLQL
jgi:hypothetical protein